MNKYKEAGIKSITDLKVYVLFLLDNIGRPMPLESVIHILSEVLNDISLDFDHCIGELEDTEHICYDEVDGVKYYTVTEKGRFVSAELYDSIDESFRENSLRLAIRYISISDSGAKFSATVTETDTRRYRVTMEAHDRFGDLMTASLTVLSRTEAEQIKKNFESKPDSVYRGVLFSATGRIEYIS
jgi:DNA-binding PadR family transcriptional regulator